MRRLRHLALTGLVWLTAAATVLGGFPHVVCRCGHSPRESAPSPDAQSGCCCNTKQPAVAPCCVPSDESKPRQHSCRSAQSEPSAEDEERDNSTPAAEVAVEAGQAVPQTTIGPAPCQRALETSVILALDASLHPVSSQFVCLLGQAVTMTMESPLPTVLAPAQIWDVN